MTEQHSKVDIIISRDEKTFLKVFVDKAFTNLLNGEVSEFAGCKDSWADAIAYKLSLLCNQRGLKFIYNPFDRYFALIEDGEESTRVYLNQGIVAKDPTSTFRLISNKLSRGDLSKLCYCKYYDDQGNLYRTSNFKDSEIVIKVENEVDMPYKHTYLHSGVSEFFQERYNGALMAFYDKDKEDWEEDVELHLGFTSYFGGGV